MKKLKAILLITVLSSSTIIGITHAEEVGGGGGGGTLSLSLDASTFDIGDVSASTLDQSLNVVMPMVEFWDERDTNTDFTMTLTATDLVSSGASTYTLDYSNISLTSDSDNAITVVSSSSTVGLTLTHQTPTVFSGTGSTSDALTVVSGDQRARIDRWQIYPELDIVIPARQDISAVDYEGTFTFSIQ